jgi:hypothetical protein
METVNEILTVIGYTLFLALVFWLLGLLGKGMLTVLFLFALWYIGEAIIYRDKHG